MEIINKEGKLNLIMDEYEEYYDLISNVRYMLGIITSKRKNIHLLINVPHHLSDIEIKELEETIYRFEIENFICIN